MAKFELYADAKGEYSWRLKASNGQTIATGGEGYSSKAAAFRLDICPLLVACGMMPVLAVIGGRTRK